jgi:hypothetical protein
MPNGIRNRCDEKVEKQVRFCKLASVPTVSWDAPLVGGSHGGALRRKKIPLPQIVATEPKRSDYFPY